MITDIEITLQEYRHKAPFQGKNCQFFASILKIARKLLLHNYAPDEIVELNGLPRTKIDTPVKKLQ